MTAGRGGLGRGLAALIPSTAEEAGTDLPSNGLSPTGATRALVSVRDGLIPDGSGPRAAPTDEVITRNLAYEEAEPTAGARSDRRGHAHLVDGELAVLPVDAIVPNSRQPRLQFDEQAHDELVESVRQVGVLQPIVVRPVPNDDKFEIVMGERRWRAAAAAGLAGVPAIVRMTSQDEMLRDALIENLQRADLNPLEEAKGFAELIAEQHLTHEQAAERLSRSRSHVTNTLRLLTLPEPVQRRIAAGVITAGHAKVLLMLPDIAVVEALASRIVAEGLSVRSLEEIVAIDRPGSRRRRSQRAPAPQMAFEPLADRLSEHFETRVKVELGKSRGRIVLEFGSVDDLRRIVGTMVPEALGALPLDDAEVATGA